MNDIIKEREKEALSICSVKNGKRESETCKLISSGSERE